MSKNFLKTAVRFLLRNKTYSFINYLCLTFGLTCAIVAALNITRATNYDRFHENYNRLYEVESNVTYFNGDQFPKELLSASLTDLVRTNVPELEEFSRVANREHLFMNGNESFTERGIYADTNFLSLFTFPLSKGSVGNILTDNNSIVISERMATKFFRSVDCIGKTLILEEDTIKNVCTVTGVLKNIPSQSFFQFDFIIPFSKFLAENKWALESGASANQVWALLSNGADTKIVNEKIKNLIKGQETTLNQELFIFPLREKILYAYVGGRRVWRELQNIVIIGCIGFAILLIACFNFINLAIAINIRRYREAGIKKVVGAQRISIIAQHFGETTIITLLSLVTAIDLAKLVVRTLNRIYNSDIRFDFSDFGIILIFAGITLFTAIASGLLPALYLSSSKPVNILKGKILTNHSFSLFRQGLIIFQFSIPIVLIICMMIIRTQDKYIRNYDLGFDKNKLLIISSSKQIESHAGSIKNDLLSVPGIESVSFSNCIPARGARVSNDVSWEGKNPSEKLHFWCIGTDYDYARTVNIEITDGRYFDKSFASDSACYVINDVAAKVMDYKNPVGRIITLDGKKGTIIGVFSGFHALDLAGPFTPTIISLSGEGRSNILIELGKVSFSEINGRIKEVFEKYESDKVFQANLYSDLLKRTELITVTYLVGFAFIISIILACLGLSGLASFTAASRTKEIGIRKINGATIVSILQLLGFNYSRWLIIASAISVPIAFLLGNFFLARFNFRTPMPYWVFLAGPVIAYIIALSAVLLQSWRAATRNPVEALRYE